MAGEKLPAAPSNDDHVLAWLKPSAALAESVLKNNADKTHEEHCRLTEIEVLKASTANIKAFLKARQEAGALKSMPTVIGLMYDLKTTTLAELDEKTGELVPLKAPSGGCCCCAGKGGCCG